MTGCGRGPPSTGASWRMITLDNILPKGLMDPGAVCALLNCGAVSRALLLNESEDFTIISKLNNKVDIPIVFSFYSTTL